MKAILLAAGEGQRLRPLTLTVPKCLVHIGGRPLLHHWLDKCAAAGISEVLINTHYLASQVEQFVNSVQHEYPFHISCIYEEDLTGTGGFVRNNLSFVAGEQFFFLAHGDNFSDIDLNDFAVFHRTHNAQISIALFKADNPRECGIAEELDADGRILKFTEKPEEPVSDLASAAMFMLSPAVIEGIPTGRPVDFSKEILPLYQGCMHGFKIPGFNIDVGNMDNYLKANKLAGLTK